MVRAEEIHIGVGDPYLRAPRALGVFRELLNDWVPEQVQAIDDGGCEAQHLHTQQVDTVPDVAGPKVQRMGNTHIHVEDEGADVEGHGYPPIPMDLCLHQWSTACQLRLC